jgi:hypothetical protein
LSGSHIGPLYFPRDLAVKFILHLPKQKNPFHELEWAPAPIIGRISCEIVVDITIILNYIPSAFGDIYIALYGQGDEIIPRH